jgi:hypothetical protein
MWVMLKRSIITDGGGIFEKIMTYPRFKLLIFLEIDLMIPGRPLVAGVSIAAPSAATGAAVTRLGEAWVDMNVDVV